MYYQAKVQIEFVNDKNQSRKRTETYLIESDTIRSAEQCIHEEFRDYSMGYEIKSISVSRIHDVLTVNE